MNKDVIYIDVEDDITSVIGKIKASRQKIIALVPPKRIGILQSAVNLRLLSRTIEHQKKHLVLITNNSALVGLAASAKIPVAKNLQSKPEIPVADNTQPDDGEDIIDGSELPIGEHAGMGKKPNSSDAAIDKAIAASSADLAGKALPPRPGQLPPKPKSKSGISVPNFDTFRKKLIIGGAAGVVLIGILVWAIVFAPRANIVITARTTDSSANPKVTLSATVPTNFETGALKSVTQQLKKDVALAFDATGTKDIGEKSKGQVIFRNCETEDPQTIPAGTSLSANGRAYVTTEGVTVPGGVPKLGGSCNPGTSSPVGIAAADIGEDYNTPSGTAFAVSGHADSSSSLYFRASASTNIAGGTKKQVKVVSASDIQKASEQLAAQDSTAIKKQLSTQFPGNVIRLEQSFKVDQSAIKPAPAPGEEAPDGKARLAGAAVYTMAGVEKSQVTIFLDGYFKKQIEGKKDQRIYKNGADKATFTNIAEANGALVATLTATAQVGPKINDTEIKNIAKGKRYGEVQTAIEGISGVEDVDVRFSPFWVKVVPDDTKRISVEFKLNGAR